MGAHSRTGNLPATGLPNTISGGEIGIQKKHLTKVTHIEAGISILGVDCLYTIYGIVKIGRAVTDPAYVQ